MKTYSTNHLLEILLTLSRAKVKFIVCGGVAAVLHGVERMTADIDIAIDFGTPNVKKFLTAVKHLGLVPRAPLPPETLIDKVSRKKMVEVKGALVFTFLDPDNPFRQIDVFLSEKSSYHILLPKSEVIKIGRCKIRVVSKRQLIGMKKKVTPSRDKDRLDIIELEKLLF